MATKEIETDSFVFFFFSFFFLLLRYMQASRHDEAEQLFRQAQLMAPTDPAVYMFTGQFLLEASRPREAAESFVRAAHLAPADFEAVFNAATTLREVKELDRAELFYRQAVQLRPHVS
jgi:tetratricopeptide (TPR) repeat protein